jgi:hypothetical protein
MDDKLQEVLIDIRERLVRVETKIDSGLNKRIDKVEDNQTWLWRTAIGSFIVSAIALIFKFGGK